MEKIKNTLKNRKVQIAAGTILVSGVVVYILAKNQNSSRYPFGLVFDTEVPALSTETQTALVEAVAAEKKTKVSKVLKAPAA